MRHDAIYNQPSCCGRYALNPPEGDEVTSAAKRFLIFILAILAFAGVRFVSEDWFYVPHALSVALGLLVAGVIIKPLAAPDLPMSRWLIVPLAGMAVCLVVLTAPRWYEHWAETLPDFLPTEPQFVALVTFYAQGASGSLAPVDCGTYGPRRDPSPGVQCAMDALEARRAFYLFYYSHPGSDAGFVREALASFPGGTYRFRYLMDTRSVPPFSRIVQSICRDPRFVLEEPGPRAYLQCGPWPTPAEFYQEVGVGKNCGSHQTMHDSALATIRKQIECVMAALEAREAFHYRFQTDWGAGYGVVGGALSWQPDERPAPVLSYYLHDDQSADAEPSLIQRTCAAPKIRLVKPASGRNSSVEIDCGDEEFPPRR